MSSRKRKHDATSVPDRLLDYVKFSFCRVYLIYQGRVRLSATWLQPLARQTIRWAEFCVHFLSTFVPLRYATSPAGCPEGDATVRRLKPLCYSTLTAALRSLCKRFDNAWYLIIPIDYVCFRRYEIDRIKFSRNY